MKTMTKIGVLIVALFVAACGGGKKENSNTAPTVVSAVTPKLHLAMLDASRMQIRTTDGSSKSDYILITFTNISGGKVVGNSLSLPQPTPSYPFNFNYVKGFNHVEVGYMNKAEAEDATDYLPEGAFATSSVPAYSAKSEDASVPNLIPMAGINGLVLLAPKQGDYAPWVYVGLENESGTVDYRLYQKPILPLKIPLSGYVSATVSTGTAANDGSYFAGASKTWDFGPNVPKAPVAPPTIMVPPVQISPPLPATPTTPDTSSSPPTVITINTVTKQTTITPVIVEQKILNLSAGSPDEIVLDSNGNVVFGYIIDWEETVTPTHYYNYLQLPTTSFARASMPLGSGSAKLSLVRPDKTRVYFDASKCQVFVNGVDITSSSIANGNSIIY